MLIILSHYPSVVPHVGKSLAHLLFARRHQLAVTPFCWELTCSLEPHSLQLALQSQFPSYFRARINHARFTDLKSQSSFTQRFLPEGSERRNDGRCPLQLARVASIDGLPPNRQPTNQPPSSSSASSNVVGRVMCSRISAPSTCLHCSTARLSPSWHKTNRAHGRARWLMKRRSASAPL